jgi:hypothetical protein
MNARLLAIVVLVAMITACNTSEPTKPPEPEPVPLEIPVEPKEPPLDTSTLEVETSAPTTQVPNGTQVSSAKGQWSVKTPWPTLAIHAALMPDKTVITWGWRRQWNRSNGDDPVRYSICKTWTDSWDSTRSLTAGHSSNWYGAGVTGNGLSYPITCPNPDNTDMFGAGHAHTPDGNLFVAGGMGVGPTLSASKGDPWDGIYYGVNNTNTFNSNTRQWQPGPRMTKARWYPTVTTLSDGQMLVSGGSDYEHGSFGLPDYARANGNVDLHERLEADGLQSLTGAKMRVPYYPWMIVSPKDGLVLEAGPQAQMRFLDANGAGTWQDGRFNRSDKTMRGYGTAMPIIDLSSSDPNEWTAKAFAFGGSGEPDTNDNRHNPDCGYRKAKSGEVVFNPGKTCPLALTSSSEINLLDGSSSAKADLKRGRRNANGVALANGQILAVGGNEFWNNRGAQHFTPELYDPQTNTWADLSPQKGIRNYHSTALLLPDATVFSAGGFYDRNFDQDPKNNPTGEADARNSKDAEILYPPYLFNPDGQPASRPWIRAAPKTVKYGQPFLIGTPDAEQITQVNLIKLGATTHAFDADQRLVKVAFTRGSERLSIQVPKNGTFAPPGHYMLFILDAQGVPSVARILKLEQ